MPWGLIELLLIAGAALLIVATAAVAWRLAHPPRRTAAVMIAAGLPTDPAEAGAPFTTHKLTMRDGAELELWLVEGLNAQGLGPPLVLLHGWGDSRMGELRWLEMLRPLFSAIVLYDQRGHGDSPQACCTWGACETADAAQVAAWLHQRTGRSVVLMGYSMGATVAIAAAAGDAAEHVSAVIADSPYREPCDVIRRAMSLQRLPGWPVASLAWMCLGGCWRGLRGLNTAEAAARLDRPLLVLHGERDAIVPVEQARAIADAAPDGQVVIFEASDHLAAAAEHAEQYTRAVRHFITAAVPVEKWAQ